MNRRGFLTSALKATAAGLLVLEHLWGRSMVGWRAVGTNYTPIRYGELFYGKYNSKLDFMREELERTGLPVLVYDCEEYPL